MKDWSRERWRKLFLRESAQQRGLWPVVTRSLRDYFVRIAEDDGTLIHVEADGAGAVQALLKAIGCEDDERPFVQRAIGTLLVDGYLDHRDGRIWVANLPAAQGDETDPDDAPPSPSAQKTSPLSPAERARRHRQRQKERDAGRDDRHDSSRNGVTNSNENRHGEPVTPSRDASRGLGQDLPSDQVETSQKNQKNQPEETEIGERARDACRDDLRDGKRDADSVTCCDDRDVTDWREVPFRSLRDALEVPIGPRSERATTNAYEAEWTEPHKWPEVVAVADGFAFAFGQAKPRLGAYGRDSGVKSIVALYAAGFTQAELVAAATAMAGDPYWQRPGARPSLSAMTPEQVRKAQAVDPIAQPLSPRVAKQLADRAARKAQETAR